ncbi:MAG: SAM-dependent chlorinase/fluorinase [Calditrichaeota bacterium]|nr:SAM-dependent chlorinase/fluorinase [Calditrichota bacterium]
MGELKKIRDSKRVTSKIITLLTDFGYRDAFVGTMKGIILRINPWATIVDISHGIDPGDIQAASFVLAQSFSFYPSGTVHVIVVDPGVGTARKAIAVKTEKALFIAPDNGVLGRLYAAQEKCVVREITDSNLFVHPVSRTFHGRDIFAPVAAHLSVGVPFASLGPEIHDYNRGSSKLPRKKAGTIIGEIIYIDRFGNLISNISQADFSGKEIRSIQIKDIHLDHLSDSYGEKNVGEALAIIGSHGFLEIAVREGNAGVKYGIEIGCEIRVFICR